jgi:hypothetical protein
LISLDEEVVGVAEPPTLAGFERSDHRMRRRAVMLRRVRVRRVIAAPDVTAVETEAKVHPFVTAVEALLAAARRVRLAIPRLQ